MTTQSPFNWKTKYVGLFGNILRKQSNEQDFIKDIVNHIVKVWQLKKCDIV